MLDERRKKRDRRRVPSEPEAYDSQTTPRHTRSGEHPIELDDDTESEEVDAE
jgi:hypothetical protein